MHKFRLSGQCGHSLPASSAQGPLQASVEIRNHSESHLSKLVTVADSSVRCRLETRAVTRIQEASHQLHDPSAASLPNCHRHPSQATLLAVPLPRALLRQQGLVRDEAGCNGRNSNSPHLLGAPRLSRSLQFPAWPCIDSTSSGRKGGRSHDGKGRGPSPHAEKRGCEVTMAIVMTSMPFPLFWGCGASKCTPLVSVPSNDV